MDNSSAQAVPGSDADLIRAVASGDASAYVGLHERHVTAARTLAGLIMKDPAQAEQVLSDAFTRLRDVLRRGAGPAEALRPYLLTVVRREARARQNAEQEPAPGAAPPDPGEPLIIDPLIADLAATPLARAFMAQPERWRAALWHISVEETEAALTAAVLGLTPGGVDELAGQARAGLITGCLGLYRSGLDQEACKSAAGLLGAHADGSLSGFDEREVQQHLRDCRQCRAGAFELAELGRSLRRVVAPVILGSAAASYLARAGTKAGAKAAPRAAARVAPKTSPKASPKTSPKASPKTSPKAVAGATAAETAVTATDGTAVVMASEASEAGAGPGRTGPLHQRRVLAVAGLVLAAFAATGLALTLTTGNQQAPRGDSHPAAAAVPTPPSSSPAPSSPAASSPTPARHHTPATVSRVKPSPSPSPTPLPSPSPTLPVLPSPQPLPSPPHRHHRHPFG
jgi:DNA-directed RNA polymerase specialized sigma24 family protein